MQSKTGRAIDHLEEDSVLKIFQTEPSNKYNFRVIVPKTEKGAQRGLNSMNQRRQTRDITKDQILNNYSYMMRN